ncbi:unnamed protein product [Peronospora belbahrii]|uniref:Origin recognition complex subunit 2 n=1 Tax=Peronospora belbahrii TaxID=622444 RepID=A0AAU9L561_9STRA|nr:unnamed protein product [Peronospora belbahrii]CAH0521096.1 unnamed protein product [Peronospora belbahrii]
MTSNGLRERFRQRELEPRNNIELGTSSANAYFTSKQIHQRACRRKKKPYAAHNNKHPHATSNGRNEPWNPCSNHDDIKQYENETQHNDNEAHQRLEFPTRKQVLDDLRIVDNKHVGERQKNQCYDTYFPAWKSELLAGYNLLFYGLGSKLTLLQKFASIFLNDSVVIQVHGYLPVVSLKYMTETIQEKILQTEVKPNQSLVHQCRDIAKTKLSTKHTIQIYLLVHSIDGLALRNPEAQTCLSWLAKAPFIAVIASMDHINGPSIWKEEDSLRFEWLCQNVDTFEPYTDEIELRLTTRTKRADASSNGVKFILQSLTPTDVATLQELAHQQLAASVTSKKRGQKRQDKLAPYQSVYEACRKKLLHSTPLAMKNSVKCLEDHGLLKQCRVNAVEYLEIPLPESIIRTDILHTSAIEAED